MFTFVCAAPYQGPKLGTSEVLSGKMHLFLDPSTALAPLHLFIKFPKATQLLSNIQGVQDFWRERRCTLYFKHSTMKYGCDQLVW